MGAPRVVIVGGGFAGLAVARELAGEPVEVTLIDRSNHHLFQPLLYQVATAGLSPGDIASPLRQLVGRAENVRIHMGELERVDLARRQLTVNGAPLEWDRLVLATGVRHSYFGHPEWERFAPGLKTLDDALEMRRRMLSAFEAAELESDVEKRRALLTFVIVGAGPTGVELAGAISEFARFTVARQYRNFDPREAKVILIEAGDRPLSAFDAFLSTRALSTLTQMQVDVRVKTRVTQVSADGVDTSGGPIAARTVFWAAGVAAPAWAREAGFVCDTAGRIKVTPALQALEHPDVYVIGDLAACTDATGRPVPGLAPAAIQQGQHVGRTLLDAFRSGTAPEFRYRDKGMMATVGRSSGIAQSGPMKLSGVIGWLAWLFIHLVYLVGFENRFLVLTQWVWAWFTYSRSARLLSHLEVPARPQSP